MRIKRLYKFRKFRREQIRKKVLFMFVLPFTSIFLGYLITSLIILPSMKK